MSDVICVVSVNGVCEMSVSFTWTFMSTFLFGEYDSTAKRRYYIYKVGLRLKRQSKKKTWKIYS